MFYIYINKLPHIKMTFQKTRKKKIPKYLLDNKNRISDSSTKEKLVNNNLINYKNPLFYENINSSFFKKLDYYLEKNSINKQEVLDLFKKKDKYLAFVCAMIWGGINATRSKDKSNTFFNKFLKHPEKKILYNIEIVTKSLEKNEFDKAFDYYRKEAKISGIGPAYFTKLFYFIGESNNKITTKPLIFDKWTQNAYLALLLQNKEFSKVKKYFHAIKLNISNSPGLVEINEKHFGECYNCYVKDFAKWSNEIGCSSSSLEEFIFGEHLGKNKKSDNPRIELWEIITSNLQFINS